MTGILSQYMMRTILASTALVLMVLLGLAGLFEFIAELDDTREITRQHRSFCIHCCAFPISLSKCYLLRP